MKEIKEEVIQKIRKQLENCKSITDVYINEDNVVVIDGIKYKNGDNCLSRAQYDYLRNLTASSNNRLRHLHKAVASSLITAIKDSGLDRSQIIII